MVLSDAFEVSISLRGYWRFHKEFERESQVKKEYYGQLLRQPRVFPVEDRQRSETTELSALVCQTKVSGWSALTFVNLEALLPLHVLSCSPSFRDMNDMGLLL